MTQMLTEEVIYQEAGQWLRMANILAWSISAVLMPIMFGAVWLALRKSTIFRGKVLLACGSLFVGFAWYRMMAIYHSSTVLAREALRSTEGGLRPERAFYSAQGDLFNKPWGPKCLIFILAVALLIAWIIVFLPRKNERRPKL